MKELRSKTRDELVLELESRRKELLEMRFKAATEGTPKPHRIRECRRDIARILGLLGTASPPQGGPA